MEFIDDHPVTEHRVRFTERTDISERDAAHVRDGAVVVWIVQAECQPPSYHPVAKDSEDRYRFNVQRVQRATVLTGTLRESAIHYLDDPDQRQGYFAFEAHSFDEDGLRDPLSELVPARMCKICLAYYDTSGVCEGGHNVFDTDEGNEEEELSVSYENAFALEGEIPAAPRSIYGPGHRGDTQALLKEQWGDL